jgi:hypothetical protein
VLDGHVLEDESWGWRKLHNYELHDLFTFTMHCYGDQIVGDQMGGACGTRGIDESAEKTLIDKTRRDQTAWKF